MHKILNEHFGQNEYFQRNSFATTVLWYLKHRCIEGRIGKLNCAYMIQKALCFSAGSTAKWALHGYGKLWHIARESDLLQIWLCIFKCKRVVVCRLLKEKKTKVFFQYCNMSVLVTNQNLYIPTSTTPITTPPQLHLPEMQCWTYIKKKCFGLIICNKSSLKKMDGECIL